MKWFTLTHDFETGEWAEGPPPDPHEEKEDILHYDGWIWAVVVQAFDLASAIERAKVLDRSLG